MIKKMDESEEKQYELFIQEIEGLDEYWGPTFRNVFESGQQEKFMKYLENRINSHDKEIERICSNYYQGFVESIRDLKEVRDQARSLTDEVVRIDTELKETIDHVEKKCNALNNAKIKRDNISSVINNMTLCLPVFSTYKKLQDQIAEKKYYHALKTLEQLEHLYLPRTPKYQFFDQLKNRIPEIRESIKDVTMSDLKDFLENIRRLSPKIGNIAMRQSAEQSGSNAELIGVKVRKKKHAPPPPNPFTGEIDDPLSQPACSISDWEDDLSAQHAIDFAPVYRCFHIYTLLGCKDVFQVYYKSQRKEQSRLVIQPPSNMHESIAGYRLYLQSVVGFFVVEDHVLNTGNGLVDSVHLEELWATCSTKIATVLRTQSAYCTDANLLLKVKDLLLLFCLTLSNYGYTVNAILEMLRDIQDQYTEILMQRWVQVFREILNGEDFLPIQVTNVDDYNHILEMFPFQDDELERADFPKKFPFSMMVPKVYQQVKEFIYACLKFSEDLHLNQSEIDDVIRKSTNLLLTRTFSGCLSAVFRKPSLALLQIIQMIIDADHLENSSVFLEQFVSNITGSNSDGQIGYRSQGRLFNVARDDAIKQMCEKLKQKLSEFIELESYDWMLVEPKGHASSFITDLIAFLRSIFQSFTNLPIEVAQKVCQEACDHIAKSVMGFMTSEDVKQISMGALQQINLDTIQCEQFAASEPVAGLEEGVLLQYFNDLRQLLDLLMSWDWSAYFHDYGQPNSKYKHVNPSTAIIVLEKIREADKKSVFSALKKSERDKKKLLDTVLKQLRQLAMTVQQSG